MRFFQQVEHFSLRRLNLGLLGLLLLGLPTASLLAAKLDRAVQFHGLAQGNYLIGDTEGALRALEICLRHDPDYLPALRLQTRILIDKEATAKAAEALQQALKRHPEDLELQLLQAILTAQLGDHAAALEVVDRVIREASPDSREGRIARQLKGLLDLARGSWEEAITAFSAGDQDRTTPALLAEAYLAQANQHADRGAWDQALDALGEAIAQLRDATAPEMVRRRKALEFERARILTQTGRREAAIESLENLSRTHPEDPETALMLSSLYAELQAWSHVTDLLPQLEAVPELRDVVLYLEGRVAFASSRIGTARERFEAAIEAQPAQGSPLLPSLLFYRARCLQVLGRGEEADAAMLQAVESGFVALSIEEAAPLARTLLRLGRADAAVPQLERVLIGVASDSAPLWAQLGRAHQAQEQYGLALSAFNESLRLQPDQADARALRGSVLRRIGDIEGARVDYQRAAELDPNQAAYFYALGLTHLQLGELIEAEKAFAEHLRLGQPDLPDAWLLHALTAYTIEAKNEARISLQHYFERVEGEPLPSAAYLSACLGQSLPNGFEDPITAYFHNQSSRKEALDWAGRADTPAEARRRIGATAFWLAQQERANHHEVATRSLLKITLEHGTPDQPEFQFARWQLGPDPSP